MKYYYIYMISNKYRGTIYTGLTNNLERRMHEYKLQINPGFAKRYNLDKLVYYEYYSDINVAIRREKQIKGWLRKKKIKLIESVNPRWKDLSAEWFHGTMKNERPQKSARM
jgi:putative endonuclease